MNDKLIEKTPCAECGMLCDPAEYHTLTYCLVMKQLGDGDGVRANLEYTVEHHPKFQAVTRENERLREALADADVRLELIIRFGKCTGTDCPGCQAGRIRSIIKQALDVKGEKDREN